MVFKNKWKIIKKVLGLIPNQDNINLNLKKVSGLEFVLLTKFNQFKFITIKNPYSNRNLILIQIESERKNNELK